MSADHGSLLGNESKDLEFKRSTALLKEAVQSLCAFANPIGGTPYFGVADNSQVVGQTVSDDSLKNRAHLTLGGTTRIR